MAEEEPERVVKMLSERKDVCTAAPDSNQISLSLPLSQGHNGVAKTIREWESANSGTADPGNKTPLLPSTGNGAECVIEMQSKANNSNPSTSDINGLPALPSAEYNGREVVMDSKDSVSMSADSYFSAESSRQPQPLPSVP